MERQTSSLGGKTVISKHVKFNKTDMNGREINTMVKRAVTVALKGGGRNAPLGLHQTPTYLEMREGILELTLLT